MRDVRDVYVAKTIRVNRQATEKLIVFSYMGQFFGSISNCLELISVVQEVHQGLIRVIRWPRMENDLSMNVAF